MVRLTRDSYYVDLVERVLGGVQVSQAGWTEPRVQTHTDARRAWSRASSSAAREVTIRIREKRRPTR